MSFVVVTAFYQFYNLTDLKINLNECKYQINNWQQHFDGWTLVGLVKQETPIQGTFKFFTIIYFLKLQSNVDNMTYKHQLI